MFATFLVFAGLPVSGIAWGVLGAVLRWAIVIFLSAATAALAKREYRRVAGCGLCILLALVTATAPAMPQAKQVSQISIDYPAEGSIFPPDIAAPTFLWRDADASAALWRIEFSLPGRKDKLEIVSSGALLQVGESDPECVGAVPPSLTAEQAAAHTWKPDAPIWEALKKGSSQAPVTVTIRGFRTPHDRQPVSMGRVTISTSKDAVGAPIFYRDVPLIVSPTEKGVIQPLPPSMIHLIKWRMRNIAEPQSKVVMDDLPTCANCHSFSRDGRTLGLDVDGPQNDKGLYALVPVAKNMTIRNQDVIRWSSFQDSDAGKSSAPAVKRFGFMSQVSPDGRYVVTSIGDPKTQSAHQTSGLVRGLADRLFNAGYNDYRFGQVFYPTRGVLAYYSQETGKLRTLPGADDPRYVQTSAFWSPDGKYLIFSRAEARDPYPPGYVTPTYANDPNETQIQYDLYRIPFNDGKGGVPERIEGASENGKSNNFPKVSPDGRWIVFVQCKNGLLMRPDSQLYIVPFAGGAARPLHSNTKLMNSWHSFSPNGRWLVFSSKARSAYTQMYLTHIDENGEDSPAILVENSTAANRAVNIPEFVNLGPEGLDHIDTPAIDFYREFDAAQQLQDNRQYTEAVPAWKVAAAKDPTDPRPYNNLGVALAATGKTSEAIDEYKKSLALNNDSSQTHNNLGSALAEAGKLDEAQAEIEKAIELNPDNGSAHINMGHIFEVMGGHRQEAIEELTKGIELAPKSSDGHNIYGVILARMGKLDESVDELQKAVELAPQSPECRYNLGRALAASSRFADALPQFEAAAKLSGGQEPAILQMLAAMYSETGQYRKAVDTAQHALDLAIRQQKDDLAAALRGNIARYQRQAQQEQSPNGGQKP
jgi:tetratricopeptide (TPR) repeat protein